MAENKKIYDVIAISPHPDDAEIGCGGTLALLSKKYNFRVAICDLTDGEPTPFNDSPEIRLMEAKEAASVLGVDRFLLGLENRTLMDTIEARMSLAKFFREKKPTMVLAPAGMTPMASPDHYQAQLITDAAIFYSRLSKWKHLMDGLPLWRISTVFYYYTVREIVQDNFPFQFVYDISDYFKDKKKALLCYKSQFKAHETYNPPIIQWIESMASYYGTLSGCRYGELFSSPKMINLDLFSDLLKTNNDEASS